MRYRFVNDAEMTKEVDYMPFLKPYLPHKRQLVTGLIVVDTATYFTQKGHSYYATNTTWRTKHHFICNFIRHILKKGLGIKHQTMIQENFSSDSLLVVRAY